MEKINAFKLSDNTVLIDVTEEQAQLAENKILKIKQLVDWLLRNKLLLDYFESDYYSDLSTISLCQKIAENLYDHKEKLKEILDI